MSYDTGFIWMLLLFGSSSWLYYCRWQDRSAGHDRREWLSSLEVDRHRQLRKIREAQAAERWVVRECVSPVTTPLLPVTKVAATVEVRFDLVYGHVRMDRRLRAAALTSRHHS